jgi:phosphoribosylglycinamide formyltransferase-1
MPLLKLAILASHGGSNMQAILDQIAAGQLAAQVVLAISNHSESGAMQRAARAGIPARHLSGMHFPDPVELDRAICEALSTSGADLVVLAGYMKRMGPLTLEAFRGRILNIHPALLPRHGGPGMFGLHPHEAVLAAGDTESGATVHLVTEEYDRGPILRQERVPVLPGDTPETLQARVLQVEHRIYADVLRAIATGEIPLPIVELT